MKGLKIILWICAVSCLLGFVFAFLPWRVMTTLTHWTGIQPPAVNPTTVFMVRVFLMTYGMVGIFFVILARNPLGYGGMLPLAAYWLIFGGIFYFADGIRYGIPVWYCSQKALSSVVLGVLILVFRKKAMSTSNVVL